MVMVGSFDHLLFKLLGICCASFSCGLGEITFLQLITRYHPSTLMAHCVGYFASGTGAAGLVGAALWWLLRQIGVQIGIFICSLLPFALPLVWFFIIPQPESMSTSQRVAAGYASVPIEEETDDESAAVLDPAQIAPVALTADDKWALLSPVLAKYMLPLFSVYLFEYIINQGVSPTLLYPVPNPYAPKVWQFLIKDLKDYYPLWQLVYQTFVFLSRSSLTFGLPPIPVKFLALPAIIQGMILIILTTESAAAIFGQHGATLDLLLISLEGLCGGLAYVNVYYHLGHEEVDPVVVRDSSVANEHGQTSSAVQASSSTSATPPVRDPVTDAQWRQQAKEFRMGSMGFADSFGILLASLIAMPTEVGLCRLQELRGDILCLKV